MQTLPYEAQLFEGNKDWWPPRLKASITDFCRKIKSKIQQATTRKIKHNLKLSEMRALQRLRNNKNLVIKKGDKSSGIVIMNKNDYETKIREMLNDINVYTKTNINDTEAVKLQADQIMHSLMRNGDITEKQCRHLTNINVRCPIFYGIPKIHKTGCPLRPIVSQTNGPTCRLSQYLSEMLMVAEKQIPYILQDTTAFLKIIKENNTVSLNTKLCTLDVASLYTNIPHEQGALWVADFFAETVHLWPNYNPGIQPISRDKMIELIMFLLKNSTFEFDDEYYVQNFGTTMGSSFSVRFANIYMHQFLRKFFDNYTKAKPDYIARLIDDLFFTWDRSREELDIMINDLNSWHPTIKFEPTSSENEVNFLDTTVFIDKNNQSLHTKLFRKPTYRVQYLEYHSNHPSHVMKAIPYSQALRYRRIIDDDEILEKELKTLKQFFELRGYPGKLVENEIAKLQNIDRNETLVYKSKVEKQASFEKFTNGGAFLPLITTYDPRIAALLRKALRTEWNNLLEEHAELKKVFTLSVPQIVFKRSTTLANTLIRAKFMSDAKLDKTLNNADRPLIDMLAELLAENNSCTKCSTAHCLCCQAIEPTDSFSSAVTKELFEITDEMNCNTKNVIYLINCIKCQKQYVGQTERRLKDRLNSHRSNIHNNRQTAVAIHFNEPLHNYTHLKIIPIEIVNESADRIKRETFWIQKLKTKYPLGLNNYPIDYTANATN